MCPRGIFGELQHLARENVIAHFSNGRDARIRPSDGQFGCTQHIPQQPQDLDDLHKINMRGRPDED